MKALFQHLQTPIPFSFLPTQIPLGVGYFKGPHAFLMFSLNHQRSWARQSYIHKPEGISKILDQSLQDFAASDHQWQIFTPEGWLVRTPQGYQGQGLRPGAWAMPGRDIGILHDMVFTGTPWRAPLVLSASPSLHQRLEWAPYVQIPALQHLDGYRLLWHHHMVLLEDANHTLKSVRVL